MGSQRIGLHVSAAGGVSNAPENAKEFGAECFQFFSRSPRGGGAAVITDEQADLFKARSKEYGFESYIHTPYYINFASKNNKIYHGSINVVREELARGTKLGVKYVMTHMGSAKDWPGSEDGSLPPEALKKAVEGLKKIFETDERLETKLLLEISAGAGAVLGDSFDELAALLEGLNRDDVHVCLDTCHLFASGYDLRSEEVVVATMKEFDKKLGRANLKLVHMNDSKKGLGDHRDLHEHMGDGHIGHAGFEAILNHPDFQKVNFILETKHDAKIKSDLAWLKKHRQQK